MLGAGSRARHTGRNMAGVTLRAQRDGSKMGPVLSRMYQNGCAITGTAQHAQHGGRSMTGVALRARLAGALKTKIYNDEFETPPPSCRGEVGTGGRLLWWEGLDRNGPQGVHWSPLLAEVGFYSWRGFRRRLLSEQACGRVSPYVRVKRMQGVVRIVSMSEY